MVWKVHLVAADGDGVFGSLNRDYSQQKHEAQHSDRRESSRGFRNHAHGVLHPRHQIVLLAAPMVVRQAARQVEGNLNTVAF